MLQRKRQVNRNRRRGTVEKADRQNEAQWFLQTISGRQIGEALDGISELRVLRHHSLPEEKQHRAQEVLDEILWWFESTDRTDAVGVATLGFNLKMLRVRFDAMLGRLERDGIWLVVQEDQVADGLHVTFWLVPETLPRICKEGSEEQYLVCIPAEHTQLNKENSHSTDTSQEEGQ